MWLLKHLKHPGHQDFTKYSKHSWTGNAELHRPPTPFGSVLDLFLFIHSQLHNLLHYFHFMRQIFFGIQWSQLIRHSCLSFSGVGNYTQEGTCLAVNSTQSMPMPPSCGNGLASACVSVLLDRMRTHSVLKPSVKCYATCVLCVLGCDSI